MKRKGLYVLATVALLALAAGCGSDEVKNTDNQVTEAVLPTEVPETPESTATPEPTATPTPTATPVPTNYMEANGIEVLGAGQQNRFLQIFSQTPTTLTRNPLKRKSLTRQKR